MVEHLVLFKARPDATSEALDEMLRRLRELKSEVPGIVDLSCGPNFTQRSKGFTHGLVVRFPNREALDAYQVHPKHQAVIAEAIRPVVVLEETLALDYEFVG